MSRDRGIYARLEELEKNVEELQKRVSQLDPGVDIPSENVVNCDTEKVESEPSEPGSETSAPEPTKAQEAQVDEGDPAE